VSINRIRYTHIKMKLEKYATTKIVMQNLNVNATYRTVKI